MLNYISLYPNVYANDFNEEIIVGPQDKSIESYIILEMMELEDIENIHIEKVEIIDHQDDVDINKHMVNINYKKKDMNSIEIPTEKYIMDGRYGEVVFTIRVSTNLHSKTIVKRILYPIEHNGYYYNNGKRQKAIWQIVDEATYSQRGKNTLKSRMPIIIYQNKHRIIVDVDGNTYNTTSYSYALNAKQRKGPFKSTKKPKAKFINPVMIYSAKMGLTNTAEFFGMKDIVYFSSSYSEEDKEDMYIFELDDIYVKVFKTLFDKYELVKNFVCMCVSLKAFKDFRVNMDVIDDTEYWNCRIGMIGAAKNKNLYSFLEKGNTNMLMIEQLLNGVTRESLRLPNYYKQNIYYLIYWMITNFDDLRRFQNTDMKGKRIRKNEYIVDASLGRKLSENRNKLIERKNRSKMNTMDTLLEIFNFGSDIIISGMRNLNDLIKSDDIVNDMSFIQDLSFSNKGDIAPCIQ